jgi:anti-sigma-K factor RskA
MSEAPDDVRSLLGAYAVNAVDADERAAVEALVAADPEAATELASLLAVAATLGDAVASDPPPALRAAVLAEVAATTQVGPLSGPRHAATAAEATDTPPTARETAASSNVTDLASRRRARPRWLAIAAAVAIGAAVPTALAVQQARRADQVEQQQQALADLLTDPSAVVVHGTMPGGGKATAIMTDSQALISASDMPDPGEGHVYQLWVLDDGKAASAGILADSGGSARALTDAFSSGDSLAVTVEPTGGSDQPTTDPVLVLSAT